jgi:hypothetical protein
MAEPISAVITGLVTLMTAYMTYRNEQARIEQQGQPAPEPTKEAQEGEQALQTVKEGVAQHGNPGEKNDLESFESDPTNQRRVNNLVASLEELSTRKPEFAALLRQSEQKLPTLRQVMRGETLRDVEQRISGKHGDHEQSMEADGDIEGGSQIIT